LAPQAPKAPQGLSPTWDLLLLVLGIGRLKIKMIQISIISIIKIIYGINKNLYHPKDFLRRSKNSSLNYLALHIAEFLVYVKLGPR
jgi:hypothetical protein